DRANGAGAHGENIADDAADAGGGALKWFHSARMIVRFDLERDRKAVADVDDAGVFLAGANENAGRFGREGFEQRPGGFIAAMLAPHHGEDAEFGVTGFAAEDFFGARVFVRRQPVLLNQFRSYRGFGHVNQSMCLRIILSASAGQDCSALTSNTKGFSAVA